jgi:hypothetical protein
MPVDSFLQDSVAYGPVLVVVRRHGTAIAVVLASTDTDQAPEFDK